MAQQTKVITKRRKFIEVDVPLTNSKIEIIGEDAEQAKGKTIHLDLTRQLRGKSVEVALKTDFINNKLTAKPIKINLMPYFIRRMIRKRISYVEDSIMAPTQQSLVQIKPFIITRKPVSNAVRRTIRNLTKNWLEDYLAERNDEEIFNDILSNRLQKPLSLKLKKTYPLSLCEIRFFGILRPLKPEEVPKIEKKKETKEKESQVQFEEIEEEKIKQAEEEIEKTQKMALRVEEGEESPKEVVEETEEKIEKQEEIEGKIKEESKRAKKPRKSRKKKDAS